MSSPIEKLGQFAFEEFGPPRYEQLAAFFERAIRAGEFSPGDRLPTVRRLSGLMSVSATTISSAFDLLGVANSFVPKWAAALSLFQIGRM